MIAWEWFLDINEQVLIIQKIISILKYYLLFKILKEILNKAMENIFIRIKEFLFNFCELINLSLIYHYYHLDELI